MMGGINADVYSREPRPGQYVLDVKFTSLVPERIETLVVCASGPSAERIPHVLHAASRVREILGISQGSGLLDLFSSGVLPQLDEHDALYGLAKLMEYVRDNLAEGSLFKLGKFEVDSSMRQKLLTVDDLLKPYRADGKGCVVGHQAEFAAQYDAGPVSSVVRASLERVCLDAKKRSA
jgi:hypothetical protein